MCYEYQSKIDKNKQLPEFFFFQNRKKCNNFRLSDISYRFPVVNKETCEFLTLPDVKKLAEHNQDQRDTHTFL